MHQVLGDLLPLAIAVTISPIPIIAEILLLFTEKPVANAGAYAAGFVVLWILVALAGTQDLSSGSDGSTAGAVVRIALGALLLVGSARQFRGRPATGEVAAMPKWMDGISSFQPRKSAAVGLVVGAANPKNIAMALGASLTVASASLTSGNQAIVMAIYTLIAVLGVLAPLIVVLVMGDRSHAILDSWKTWLAQNNAAVMSVLFAVFGVVLISKGISGL
jgi:hypothetical protein